MSELLILQFQSTGDEFLQWFHTLDGKISQSGRHSIDDLADLKNQFPPISTVILLPASDCLVTSVTIPSTQRRQQLKAIPFALEEQLADDIESMHFAVGKRSENGELAVIAIAKSKMQHYLDILGEAKIIPTAILPISALLEAPLDAWSIFKLNEEFIVNQGGTCWSGSEDDVKLMLGLSIEKLEDGQLPGLLYWGANEQPDWLTELGFESSSQIVQDPHQSLLSRYSATQINLLQGEFEIQDDWSLGWNIWRRAAMFAAIAILIKIAIMATNIYTLNSEKETLKSEIANLYHQVAPGARIVDPRRQMQQLLSKGNAGGASSQSFFIMVYLVAEGLARIPNVEPTNLSYDGRKGEIRLDIPVANLPELDQLKDYLTQKGLTIEVGGASAQGSRYSGRLMIRSNG